MPVKNTIKTILQKAVEILKNSTQLNPINPVNNLQQLDFNREAEALLMFVLNQNRAYLRAFDEQVLNDETCSLFFELIHKRSQNIPFAYITGYKEFWGLALKVTPATLIPRPDTEIMIETALKKFNRYPPSCVIDLGTGSGAIACALKKEFPSAKVIASDISLAALGIAQTNAETHQLAIEFTQSAWFENIKHHNIDLICSNPPYIAENDPHLQQNGLNYEPFSALVAPNQGYQDLFTIIEQAPQFLATNGFLMLEHGYEQGAKVRHHFAQHHYKNIETIQDYGGNERITIGQYALH